MPPRAPVIWATTGVGAERFRKHLDERHRELSVQAKLRSRTYRRSRADPASDEARKLRGEFLAALGRLSAFEAASLRIMRCRYQVQLDERSDDLTRDYFQLWQIIARHSGTGVAARRARGGAIRLLRDAARTSRRIGRCAHPRRTERAPLPASAGSVGGCRANRRLILNAGD